MIFGVSLSEHFYYVFKLVNLPGQLIGTFGRNGNQIDRLGFVTCNFFFVEQRFNLHKIKFRMSLKALKYVGCYEDKSIDRDMNGLNSNINTINGNSIETCIDMCKERAFAYAGMQNG